MSMNSSRLSSRKPQYLRQISSRRPCLSNSIAVDMMSSVKTNSVLLDHSAAVRPATATRLTGAPSRGFDSQPAWIPRAVRQRFGNLDPAEIVVGQSALPFAGRSDVGEGLDLCPGPRASLRQAVAQE